MKGILDLPGLPSRSRCRPHFVPLQTADCQQNTRPTLRRARPRPRTVLTDFARHRVRRHSALRFPAAELVDREPFHSDRVILRGMADS